MDKDKIRQIIREAFEIQFLNEGLSEEQLNNILDKISESGLESLSAYENKLLKSYSDKNIDVEKEIERYKNKFKTAKRVLDDIPLRATNKELKKNIGRFIVFKKDESRGMLANSGAVYEIVDIQKMFGHNKQGQYVSNIVGYRVALVGMDDDFGRPALPEDIIFTNISEEEAVKINKRIVDELDLGINIKL
jgi:hypothetical protein